MRILLYAPEVTREQISKQSVPPLRVIRPTDKAVLEMAEMQGTVAVLAWLASAEFNGFHPDTHVVFWFEDNQWMGGPLKEVRQKAGLTRS
jgi:hypothetical protein